MTTARPVTGMLGPDAGASEVSNDPEPAARPGLESGPGKGSESPCPRARHSVNSVRMRWSPCVSMAPMSQELGSRSSSTSFPTVPAERPPWTFFSVSAGPTTGPSMRWRGAPTGKRMRRWADPTTEHSGLPPSEAWGSSIVNRYRSSLSARPKWRSRSVHRVGS